MIQETRCNDWIQNIVHKATQIGSVVSGSLYWHQGQWCASLFGGHIRYVALGSQGQTVRQISKRELREREMVKKKKLLPTLQL